MTLLGARSGAGEATFPNGDSYKGEFADGSRDGIGEYVYAAAAPAEDEEPKPPVATYEGKWVGGSKGISVLTYDSGAKYHGAFKDGKFEGQGTMYYPNGDAGPCTRRSSPRPPRHPAASERRASRCEQWGAHTARGEGAQDVRTIALQNGK